MSDIPEIYKFYSTEYINFTELLTEAEWEHYYKLKNEFDTSTYATVKFRTLLYNQVRCGVISFNTLFVGFDKIYDSLNGEISKSIEHFPSVTKRAVVRTAARENDRVVSFVIFFMKFLEILVVLLEVVHILLQI